MTFTEKEVFNDRKVIKSDNHEYVLRRFEVWRTRCQLFIIIITSALLLCPDTLCLDFSSVLSWPLTSDLQIMLCSSSMQQEKNKVLCKSSSCCCCFFTVCPSSPDVSVSVQFIWLLSNVASFFCLFVEAFPRLRLLHFSTLRCCSNVTVTFVTERLFTVGVCTRLWPLVFGLYPRTFVSFLLFFSLIHLNVWQKTKQKKNFTCFYSVAFLPVV